MLRHNRAETYLANKKYKERDKIHGEPRPIDTQWEMYEYLKKRNRFSLREYLKKTWDITY